MILSRSIRSVHLWSVPSGVTHTLVAVSAGMGWLLVNHAQGATVMSGRVLSMAGAVRVSAAATRVRVVSLTHLLFM